MQHDMPNETVIVTERNWHENDLFNKRIVSSPGEKNVRNLVEWGECHANIYRSSPKRNNNHIKITIMIMIKSAN